MQFSGVTTLQFSRRLNTSDDWDYAIGSAPFYLTYALGASDGFGTSYAKHYETGSALINFSITSGSALYVPPASTGGSNASAVSLGINASAPQFVTAAGDMKVWWSVGQGNITFTMWAGTTG